MVLLSAVVQSLPDFGDRLRARDCELMLQYLTVPYLRIPLIMKFFSDPVRMQVPIFFLNVFAIVFANMMDEVLFEPTVK